MPAVVSADSIIADLDHLWVSLAGPGAAGAESRAVLRACAMTLVVLAEESDGHGAHCRESSPRSCGTTRTVL